MEITHDMQNSTDYDWFAVGSKGNIAHFASGGSKIPDRIARSEAAVDLLAAYFRDRETLSPQVDLTAMAHAYLLSYRGSSNAPLKSFLDFSQRGLYSYDIAQPSNLDCGIYQMISAPCRKLHISELPLAVQQGLRNLCIHGDFGVLEALDIDTL